VENNNKNNNNDLKKEKKKTNLEDKDTEYNELEERKNELKDRLKYGMRKKKKRKNSNENGDKDPKKDPKKKFNFKTVIMLLFVVTIIMSLPSMMDSAKTKDQKIISYTEFLKKANNGEFKVVQEKEGYVIGKQKLEDTVAVRARMISNRVSQDTNLMKALTQTSVEIKSEDPAKTPLIVQILISWFPMLLLVGIWIFMMNKMKGGGNSGPSVFNMGKSRAKDNGENISNVKFDDVAGIEEAKQELVEVVDFLKEPEKYKKIGASIPKGVLLLGAPGTGKTLLARAVAGEAAVPFFTISGSEFVEMFVGVGASRVRDLFNKARKAAPCIVFIDEIDAVGRKRGSGQGGGNDEREQTLNQLLVEMDGFSSEETIIVIAATNRPEILDKALTRPGRFDRQVVVDKPDIKGREAILHVHVKGKKIAKNVDLHTLAKKTPGFVGADLANLLNEAAILAARQHRDIIMMEDLEEASEKVSIGPARKSRVTVEKEKHIVAYHEVGHAMIQTFYKDIVDPVHKVTIVPRGMAALGYTMSLPTEDRYLRSKKEYLADLRGLLGGRAAEEVVFGDITTGASNDIERATGIAHAMVTKLGMSDRFGPVLLDATKDGDMFQNKIYGEETAKSIDEEIRKMINEAYDEVKTTLRDNYDLLDKISKALLERETITGEELNILMDGGELEPLKPLEDVVAKGLDELKEELIKKEVEEEKEKKLTSDSDDSPLEVEETETEPKDESKTEEKKIDLDTEEEK
jgi:cell division protease FtsH